MINILWKSIALFPSKNIYSTCVSHRNCNVGSSNVYASIRYNFNPV